MQTTTSSYEADGGYAAKRGHVPTLSISDDSHHVTETIGHLYGDSYDRDTRRLSFLPTPQGETLSVSTPNPENTSLDAGRRIGEGSAADNRLKPDSTRPTITKQSSFERDPSSPVHLSPTDAANSSFPLTDIDYESNPDAIKQEYHTLAAIRRMSMDVTGDPDLPSYSNFQVPSIAPSASADENDASRLFWVPARLHPELAPKEFRSFLESRKEQIQRRSGDYSSSLGVEREESKGGLRRKRSKLSRQIDDSQEYVDGADRLERKRAEAHDAKGDTASPNLQELEEIVNDKKQVNTETLALLGGIEKLDLSTSEDKPILPAAPPGHSLKRSTRTQYRKGSLKKGERLPYSKRLGRTPEMLANSVSSTLEDPPAIKPLMRSSTDPGRSLSDRNMVQDRPKPAAPAPASPASTSTALAPGSTVNATFEPMLEPNAASSSQRQWQSRVGTNGRSTLNIPPSAQTIPQIIETPPSSSEPERQLQSGTIPERTSSHESSSSQANSIYNKRHTPQRQAQSPQTLSDIASHPSPIPGNSSRTDSLSVIPTFVEEKRSDSKKHKDKKESEGSRKSSWPWSRGSDDKDKKKESEGKKSKKQHIGTEKAYDKQDNTRLDVLQNSIDSVPRGRESLILERPVDQRLEEERRKESQRKSSDSKRDKESGLLSSIFGGGKKRSGSDHKKSLSRTLSPEPTYVKLIPDQDYPWTRFPIMEERAIYRMAHIKLANPRRPLHSQVLLSNFMYSYLSKVQKMHPQLSIPTSPSQRVQQQQQQMDQPDEYTQYQRYQEQYSEQTYEEYNYSSDEHGDQYVSERQDYENGNVYGTNHHQQHYDGSYGSLGDAAQLENDEEMW
ncbi:telomere silencing protein Zds1, putative [Talaromyces stipitatus ATCC 10500]|uniref:Telomere silencing protein Zds1, putative n=1 Tax=Talaromyces stipitatus (strain ATCC 10500 / CBS 375.48 / QM 6759 / NRRL 1006) TaxID=441959 RepID=B8LY80_TALSN|nr:telomere silencing protein Zds1, putative [Talaromyces stipitatus ATCC 10500]EED23325.1 telomere silencing protein Zds1, putative [Talaromyces stipitatus ATCC 10500]